MTASTPKRNLVALSSAAIVAVYAAGFVRTRAAAARIAEREDRRPSIRATSPRPPQAVASTPAPATAEKLKAFTKLEARPTESRDTAVAVSAPNTEPKAAVEAAPTTTVTPAQAQASPLTPPADSAKHADSARVVWRDGYYFGWGTSRHGDIQAAVEVKEGRIASATITQCLTRYSCSWIAHLPGQVVGRQSPEVDFVSGATESTNAFYYAVVEALKQAK